MQPAVTGRRLGRDVAVYGLSGVLIQIVALATTPVYTRALGPSGYGVLELLTVTVSFVITLLFEGMGVAAVRLYFAEPEERRASLLSTGFMSTVGITALTAGIAVVGARPLARALLGTGSAATAFTAAAIYLPVAVAARFSAEALRVQRRPWAFLGSSLLAAVVGGGFAVVLVLGADRGARGVYEGLTAGATAALLVNLVYARTVLTRKFSGEQLRRLVRFGGPLVLSAAGGWSLVLMDRVILVHFVDLKEVGHYGLANRLAGVLLIATYTFGTAWVPYILALANENAEAEPRVRADVLHHWLAGMAILAVAVALLSNEAVKLVGGAAFEPAADVMPMLALGGLMFSTLTVTQTPFLIEHRTAEMAALSLSATAVNIVACIVLIPPLGIHGAALATVIGFGWQAGAYYRRAQCRRPAPYDVHRMLAVLALALPFLAGGLIEIEPAALGVGLKAAAIAAYMALLLVFKLVDIARLRSEVRMMFSG